MIFHHSSSITHFLSLENPQLIHHLFLALKPGCVFIPKIQNCQLFVGLMDWLGAVRTKWLPVSLMEPLLSHISLHFQLKREALYPHKNCRATTLYSKKKKAYNEKNNNLYKAYFCLSHTKSHIVLPYPQPRFALFTTLNLFIYLFLCLPMAHIFSLSHSKFQIFPPLNHSPKTTETNSLKHTNINP